MTGPRPRVRGERERARAYLLVQNHQLEGSYAHPCRVSSPGCSKLPQNQNRRGE
jgi:hypothetical protein